MYKMTRADITAQLGFFEDTARKDDAERFLSKAERKRLEADIADHRKWLEARPRRQRCFVTSRPRQR